MATHSSILAWKTPRTEEPDKLQSLGITKELDTKQIPIRCNFSFLFLQGIYLYFVLSSTLFIFQ